MMTSCSLRDPTSQNLNETRVSLNSCPGVNCRRRSKCLIMLVVFPPLDEMDALHWLHLALLSSVRLKYSQTLERLCLTGAMSASFLKRQRRVCGVITPIRASAAASIRESLRRPSNGTGALINFVPVQNKNRSSVPNTICLWPIILNNPS